MFAETIRIAILGMGPRGLSVLERLYANIPDLLPREKIEIHCVDPYPAGAGNVWRTDQSRQLLMNTVSSQITLFTDPSVTIEGAQVPGPSLYEWAHFLALMGGDSIMGGSEPYEDWVMEEARDLGPNDYPTRAFYGQYLKWVFQRLVSHAPEQVSVHVHETRAVALDEMADGMQVIRFEDKFEPLVVNGVVLALGHTPTQLTDEERSLHDFAKEHALFYLSPSNPADVDMDGIQPGEPVILRGLGLNFFDYMALLTLGRGGRFVREGGRLVYQASGREPKMYAGSRRGIPYHSRGENEKGASGRHMPLLLTNDVIAHFRDKVKSGEGVNFRGEVWPLIAKEVETVYYATMIAGESCNCQGSDFQEQYLALPYGSEEEKMLLDQFGIAAADRWDWQKLSNPYGDFSFESQEEFRLWLLDYLREDLAEAKKGNLSGPLKAALDLLRDLRNEVRLIVDHAGIDGDSYRKDLEKWYTPLNAFLSIGPPAKRIEQMIALIEAGVLEVLGPDMKIEQVSDPSCFRVTTRLQGAAIEAQALIEARLPETDLRRTADPLLSYLLRTGQCRPYEIQNPDGTAYQTGGLAVTSLPYRLVDAQDRVYASRFAYGVPTEGVHWVTAAGIRPGVNSVTLCDSDAISRALLQHVGAAAAKELAFAGR